MAPYEADAQLAYLEKQGIIDGIVTEDSDLLVFGCKRVSSGLWPCHDSVLTDVYIACRGRQVLFKLDSNGDCVEILQSRFSSNRQLSFVGWTEHEFRQMAILSGCDYLESISGMGLKNAHRLLRRYKTVEKVLQAVRLEGRMKVPPTYSAEFRRAELTFVHQRVFDPRTNTIVTLTPLPPDIDDSSIAFIGPDMSDAEACGIAHGEIDPISRLPMVDIAPEQTLAFAPAHSRNTPSSKKSASRKVDKAEAGQRSLKSFFSAQPSSQGAIRNKRPGLSERDVNVMNRSASASTLRIESGPDVFGPIVDDSPRPLKRAYSETKPATTSMKSKFFDVKGKGKASEDEDEVVLVHRKQTQSAIHATEAMDVDSLDVPRREDKRMDMNEVGFWEGCDDLGDLVTGSPPRLGNAPNSSPYTTTPDASGRKASDKSSSSVPDDEDDAHSGIISSPASSLARLESESPVARKIARTPAPHVVGARPASADSMRTSPSAMVSSDPIEPDEDASLGEGGEVDDDEDNIASVARGLRERFCFRSSTPRTPSGGSVSLKSRTNSGNSNGNGNGVNRSFSENLTPSAATRTPLTKIRSRSQNSATPALAFSATERSAQSLSSRSMPRLRTGRVGASLGSCENRHPEVADSPVLGNGSGMRRKSGGLGAEQDLERGRKGGVAGHGGGSALLQSFRFNAVASKVGGEGL